MFPSSPSFFPDLPSPFSTSSVSSFSFGVVDHDADSSRLSAVAAVLNHPTLGSAPMPTTPRPTSLAMPPLPVMASPLVPSASMSTATLPVPVPAIIPAATSSTNSTAAIRRRTSRVSSPASSKVSKSSRSSSKSLTGSGGTVNSKETPHAKKERKRRNALAHCFDAICRQLGCNIKKRRVDVLDAVLATLQQHEQRIAQLGQNQQRQEAALRRYVALTGQHLLPEVTSISSSASAMESEEMKEGEAVRGVSAAGLVDAQGLGMDLSLACNSPYHSASSFDSIPSAPPSSPSSDLVLGGDDELCPELFC